MAALVLFAAFSSCSDDKNDGTDEGIEAKLLTFGFYAEDNSSILSEDYIATLSSTAAKVTMPAFIDKSALVARFTTNDGNIVLVDGVTQVSGTTANDFTAPVDYIVSNGKQNVKYTVTITKSSNMALVAIPKFADAEIYGGGKVLKLSPTNNIPYLAFKHRKSATEDNKIAVVKFEDGAWKAVGPLAGFSDGEVASSYLDLDFGAAGIPYVAFSDNSVVAENGAVKGAASIMKWSGTTWEYVGNKGFIAAQSQNLHMVILNDMPMVLQKNNKAGVYARREMIVSTYNNSWTNGAITSAGAGYTIADCDLAKAGNNAYAIAISATNSMYSVHKYSNGQWEALLPESLESGATHTYSTGAKITVSENGVVYTLTGDDATTAGVYQERLKKYDPETKVWSTVGGNPLPLGFNLSTSSSIAVAIAPDGTPFVAYRDQGDQDYPKVIYLDNETKQWSDPVKLADVASDDIDIVFSSTGVGYISFVDSDNHVAVYKYIEK